MIGVKESIIFLFVINRYIFVNFIFDIGIMEGVVIILLLEYVVMSYLEVIL